MRAIDEVVIAMQRIRGERPARLEAFRAHTKALGGKLTAEHLAEWGDCFTIRRLPAVPRGKAYLAAAEACTVVRPPKDDRFVLLVNSDDFPEAE